VLLLQTQLLLLTRVPLKSTWHQLLGLGWVTLGCMCLVRLCVHLHGHRCRQCGRLPPQFMAVNPSSWPWTKYHALRNSSATVSIGCLPAGQPV
jgi:hypothetical protein